MRRPQFDVERINVAAKRQGDSGHEKTPGDGGRRKKDAMSRKPAGKRRDARALPPEAGPGTDVSAATGRAPPAEAASDRFPVVGIGASAGGLEALQEFFGNMPADTGMGFVVVTHQHPGHVSMLPALLARSTSMPVVEATRWLARGAEPRLCGPPGRAVGDRRRRAAPRGCRRRPRRRTCRSTTSSARWRTDLRERAICVVLSGTGTDGTLGMRAVKAEAGMAMVQEAQLGQVCRNARQRRGHRAGRLCPARRQDACPA